MSHEVIMPVLGMNQDTAIISDWVKQEGEFVTVGDVLMAVETDKAIQEIEARASGYLSEVRYPTGVAVPVGEVIARLVEQMPDSNAQSTKAVSNEVKSSEPDQSFGEKSPAAVDTVVATAVTPLLKNAGNPKTSARHDSGRTLASPKAKRIASQLGLRVDQIANPVSNQPVHSADVIAAAKTLISVGLQGSQNTVPVENHSVPENWQGTSSQHSDPCLSIQSDATGIKDCAAWLQETTVNILMGHLAAALAVSQLRLLDMIESSAPTCVLVDAWNGTDIESSILINPDQSRVSQIELAGFSGSESIDLHVICISGSRVSDIELARSAVPTLAVVVNGDQLKAHIRGFDSVFSSKLIRFSENLAFALEQPLLHLR